MENNKDKQAIQKWNEARFNEAIYSIVNDLADLTDCGQSQTVLTCLYKAFYAYLLESRVPVKMLNEDGEEVVDHVSYWANYTIETLSKIIGNMHTLDVTCKDVKGISLASWIDQRVKESKEDVANTWANYSKNI